MYNQITFFFPSGGSRLYEEGREGVKSIERNSTRDILIEKINGEKEIYSNIPFRAIISTNK